jgi:hypothetical protein
MVKIWKFDKAPMEYRLLHPLGQVADWIAHVPTGEDAGDFEALLTIATRVNATERQILADRSLLYFGHPLKKAPNQAERDMVLPATQHGR